jgi:hypothetical protein
MSDNETHLRVYAPAVRGQLGKKDVDGRDKPGHDALRGSVSNAIADNPAAPER